MMRWSLLLAAALCCCGGTPPSSSPRAVVVTADVSASSPNRADAPAAASGDGEFDIPIARPIDPCPDARPAERGRWIAIPPSGLPRPSEPGSISAWWLGRRLIALREDGSAARGAAFDPCTLSWQQIPAGGPHQLRFMRRYGPTMVFASDGPRGRESHAFDSMANTWHPTIGWHAGHPLGKRVIAWGAFRAKDKRMWSFASVSVRDLPSGESTPVDRLHMPSVRTRFTRLELGDRYYFIWGGERLWTRPGQPGRTTLNDGAILDVPGARWIPIAMAGAPSPRRDAKAVWTGSRFVVLGGIDWTQTPVQRLDGGMYDPASRRWTALPGGAFLDDYYSYITATGSVVVLMGNPSAPRAHVLDLATKRWRAIRLPSEAVGIRPRGMLPDGRLVMTAKDLSWVALFDPSTGAWQPSSAPPLQGRSSFKVAFTGRRLLVWGGIKRELTAPCHSRRQARNPKKCPPREFELHDDGLMFTFPRRVPKQGRPER
jgi:hypothetical protein